MGREEKLALTVIAALWLLAVGVGTYVVRAHG